MRLFRIEVSYGTGHWFENEAGEDEDNAIARMWERLSRAGVLCLPMAYQSARVVSSEPMDGE